MEEDRILEFCRDALEAAGYGNVELNPGGIHLKARGNAYSVIVIESEYE